MKRIRKARWAVIGLTIGVVAVIGFLRASPPHERRLMEVAHPVVGVKSEKEETYWISMHQLLIVTTEQKADEDDGRNHASPLKHWKGFAELFDTSTRTRTRLSGLTHLLNRDPIPPVTVIRPEHFEMSPDGLWLLWQVHDIRHNGYFPRASHLDGSHYRVSFDANGDNPKSVPSLQASTRKLPERTLRWEDGVAPQQTAIFYHLWRMQTNSLLARVYRMIPRFHQESATTEDLWVSRADGRICTR